MIGHCAEAATFDAQIWGLGLVIVDSSCWYRRYAPRKDTSRNAVCRHLWACTPDELCLKANIEARPTTQQLRGTNQRSKRDVQSPTVTQQLTSDSLPDYIPYAYGPFFKEHNTARSR